MMTNEGKGSFVQTVRVEFPVRIDPGDSDFSEVTVADLQAATERYIAERLGSMVGQTSEIVARGGVSGYRYFFPGTEVKTDAKEYPFRVSLTDLLAMTKAAS